MASLFKQKIIRYVDARGNRVGKKTPGARRTKVQSKKWYGQYRDRNGDLQRVPLSTDKTVSGGMLNELVRKEERAARGDVDPFEEHRTKPLTEHLADFRASLESKGCVPRHIQQAVKRVHSALDGTDARFLADLDADKVAVWLTTRRANKPAIQLPDGQQEFRLVEVTALLAISPSRVQSMVRRHRLQAHGHGRNRRYARATVEAIAERTTRGLSPETVNRYVQSLRAFGHWLERSDRWPCNPFKNLALLNTATDRRHDRRELQVVELHRLLTMARQSERSFSGLTGEDRYHLYAVACGTGFRASALASLVPENFNLSGEPPTVTLPARFAKNRKTKVQPLPPDVAGLLRGYLQDRPAGDPVWGGTWARTGKGADMLRIDLEAAGIPYSVEGPDGPLFADFHALRHSYLTLGGRAGIDLRTLQELAGHSTPVLTARYSHRRLNDLAGAVEKLPRLLPVEEQSAPAEEDLVTLMVTLPTDVSGRSLSAEDGKRIEEDTAQKRRNHKQSLGFVAPCREVSAGVGNEGEEALASAAQSMTLKCSTVPLSKSKLVPTCRSRILSLRGS